MAERERNMIETIRSKKEQLRKIERISEDKRDDKKIEKETKERVTFHVSNCDQSTPVKRIEQANNENQKRKQKNQDQMRMMKVRMNMSMEEK